MLHIILNIICIYLIILGLVETIRIFTLLIIDSKRLKNTFVIIPISGHNEEIEYTLRSTITQFKWEGYKNQKIICLDLSMDNETRKICEMICKDYDFIDIYSVNEFEKTFDITLNN